MQRQHQQCSTSASPCMHSCVMRACSLHATLASATTVHCMHQHEQSLIGSLSSLPFKQIYTCLARSSNPSPKHSFTRPDRQESICCYIAMQRHWNKHLCLISGLCMHAYMCWYMNACNHTFVCSDLILSCMHMHGEVAALA
jgi:hypothetical protein